MDERLLKRLEVAKTLLAGAALEIDDAAELESYRNHVARDEIDLALDCLESLGDRISMSPHFWWNLKKAAEVMGLESRYDSLRSKRRKAQPPDSI